MSHHPEEKYDVFMSHSHNDATEVEQLACRIEDRANLKVWLDKWRLVPGKTFIPHLGNALKNADACAICLGETTPAGWFEQEMGVALNIQMEDPSFRILPVLFPGTDIANINEFLKLRTWVDFREGFENEYQFNILICGILGKPPGRPTSQKKPAGPPNIEVLDNTHLGIKLQGKKVVPIPPREVAYTSEEVGMGTELHVNHAAQSRDYFTARLAQLKEWKESNLINDQELIEYKRILLSDFVTDDNNQRRNKA